MCQVFGYEKTTPPKIDPEITRRVYAHDYKPVGPNFVLADLIRSHKIHYGDPPNIHCCAGGSTMNSTPLRVIEYWHRGQKTYTKAGFSGKFISPDAFDWARDKSLETKIHRTVKQLS